MSTAVLILGKSGTGKTASLRDMPPADTLLIQVVRKPLPFRAKGWNYFHKDTCKEGNIIVSDHWETILKTMRGTRRKVIVIDDFQYVLANEFMRRSDEKGFDKFTDIGRHAWELITAASDLPPDVRVYILAHSDTNDSGETKMKTIGKLLDEKITPEGLFTIVLRTSVVDEAYRFATRNSGSDTVKAPIGMFEEDRIENNLAAVDAAIVEYFNLAPAPAAAAA